MGLTSNVGLKKIKILKTGMLNLFRLTICLHYAYSLKFPGYMFMVLSNYTYAVGIRIVYCNAQQNA